LVHHSDISWTEASEEAIKSYNKGDTVKAKILTMDVEKERISLGVKQLDSNPVDKAFEGVSKGTVVTCEVTEVDNNGIHVKFNDNLTAYIKKADLSKDKQDQRPERFAVGDRVDAKITSVTKSTQKVNLSIKALEIEEQKKAIEEFGSADSGATLGDILGAALDEAKEDTKESKSKATKKKDE
jgi:small subunit ribosomal protein S1